MTAPASEAGFAFYHSVIRSRVFQHVAPVPMKFLQISFLTRLFPDRVKPAAKPQRARRRPIALRADPPCVVSDSELWTIWLFIRNTYFPERPDLDHYTVIWSTRRQKRVLACCDMNKRVVRVANELRSEEHTCWLEPLLFHEMCHAVLGANVSRSRGRRMWHGREFRALERRHPGIAALDRWIKSGGWSQAVRSARSRAAYRRRIKGAGALRRQTQ